MSVPQVDPERVARNVIRATGQPIDLESHCRDRGGRIAARYRLANGLRIILMPDPTAPVFAYQTWYGVGSKHEDPNRTGLAHLFEHLMFKATEQHPAGEFDAELERRGSETNAGTWLDWTYYTESLASSGDNLETVIHFEVDRMASLILDEATLASELEVVKNERRMTVDNSVAGTVSEHLMSLAYEVHPYGWPTIGRMAHLDAMTVDDLRAFYRSHYAPNNATVVVVGDVDPAATLGHLVRAYAPLPAESLPERRWSIEPPQVEPRLRVLEQPVIAPQVAMAFHIPPQPHPDFAAVQMLVHALTAGDTGRLYRRLVTDEEMASDVEGHALPLAEDPSLLELAVTLREGADWRRAIEIVQEELNLLMASGVSELELDKAQNGLELAALQGLLDVESRAEALGHWQVGCGDYSRAFAVPYDYQRIDEEDLARVARQVFAVGNRNTVVAVGGEEG